MQPASEDERRRADRPEDGAPEDPRGGPRPAPRGRTPPDSFDRREHERGRGRGQREEPGRLEGASRTGNDHARSVPSVDQQERQGRRDGGPEHPSGPARPRLPDASPAQREQRGDRGRDERSDDLEPAHGGGWIVSPPNVYARVISTDVPWRNSCDSCPSTSPMPGARWTLPVRRMLSAAARTPVPLL